MAFDGAQPTEGWHFSDGQAVGTAKRLPYAMRALANPGLARKLRPRESYPRAATVPVRRERASESVQGFRTPTEKTVNRATGTHFVLHSAAFSGLPQAR
jgi:hypothetical protein